MWKFIEGASKPIKKQKLTDDDHLNNQRVYDREKRVREFSQEWLKRYPWLLYEHGKMFCTICMEIDKSGSGTFIIGCTNFRNSALETHNTSHIHKECRIRYDALRKPPGESTAEKTVKLINSAAFTKMMVMFRNAHYIAKSGRPYTDFKSLCQLDKAKGIDIGDTYINEKSCQKFIQVISDVERQKQDAVFGKSHFLSLISDGATDVASMEAEICYVRVSVDCQVSTHFLGIRNVHKANAETISLSLADLLDRRFHASNMCWKSKIIGMGTDGASVMLGVKSGVVQRMRSITNRNIFGIHCTGHRLELAYKDSTKGLRLHEKCMTLMLNLYLFYKCSPLNRASLKASFTSLGQQILIPTRVGGTRWLPHTERALKHVLTGSNAIIQHLEQLQNPGEDKKESSAKARNFLRLLKDKQVMYWLNMLLDVVKCLGNVALSIQNKDSTLWNVWFELTSAKKILQKYTKVDGPSLKRFVAAADLEEESSMPVAQRKQLLSTLIKALDDRFEGDLSLFKDSSFLCIQTWPEDLDDYCDEEVGRMADMCGSLITTTVDTYDATSVEPEWCRFKSELIQSGQVKRIKGWPSLSQQYNDRYPNFFLLVNFLLTLPASSVDAERGFSKMKLIKNDWRSRLREDNLTDLMLLDIASPDVAEFNPEPAVHLWNTSGSRQRRPFFMDCHQNKVTSSLDMEIENVENNEATLVEPEPIIENFDMLADAEERETNDGVGDQIEEEEKEEDRRDLLALQTKSYRLLLSLMN